MIKKMDTLELIPNRPSIIRIWKELLQLICSLAASSRSMMPFHSGFQVLTSRFRYLHIDMASLENQLLDVSCPHKADTPKIWRNLRRKQCDTTSRVLPKIYHFVYSGVQNKCFCLLPLNFCRIYC